MMCIRRRIIYRGEVVDIKYFTRTDKPKLDMEKLLKIYIGRLEEKSIAEITIFMCEDFIVKYVGDYSVDYSLVDVLETVKSIITFFDSIDDSTTLSI